MTGAAGERAWSGVSSGLFGRDAALSQIQGLLTAAPRCAVVVGEPGAGKSALLTAVADLARRDQWIVLSTAGRITEQSLPFGALSELLMTGPLPPHSPGRQRRDRLLQCVRGEEDLSPVSPLGLRLDVLSWLEDVSNGRPLLVSVDDAQWIDTTTLQILAFLAHRVADLPVALLFATRSEQPPTELAGLRTVHLGGLDVEDATRLLQVAQTDLSPLHRHAIIERAAGNPLALVEFARAMPETPDGMMNEADLPTRIEQAFTAGLESLPADTRTALLLIAAGAEDLGVLARVVGADHLLTALEPAERADLARIAGQQVQFRHPLVRQAVYATATAAERVRAHHALADAYEDEADRRAWHRAAATVTPDEDVAAGLAAAAQRAMDRVAYPEAARALRRAAELTPDRHDRERRLMMLIQVGMPTGQTAAQLALAQKVRDETDDPAVRAYAQQYVAFALTQTMNQEAARLALEDAIAQTSLVDDLGAWASLTSLAVLVYQTSADPGQLLEWVQRLGRDEAEDPLVTACRIWIRASAEPAARPPSLIAELRAESPLPPGAPPVVIGLRSMLLGSAAWVLDLPNLAAAHLGEARAILERANSQELVPTLVALAQVHTDRVALDEAEETGRILFEITDAQGLDYQRAVAQHSRAAAAALRGDRLRARELAEDVFSRIDLASCVALDVGLRLAVADSWFGKDELARWNELRAAFDASGDPRHGRLSIRALAPAVSASLWCGKAAEARLLVEAVSQRLVAPLGTYQAMVLTFSRAMLATDDETDELFRRVVDAPLHAPWAFELANARLEYGRWLRRHRRFPEAQNQLVPALRTFERLGTAPWASEARTELQRAGGELESPNASIWTSLTAQERQIVRLAATGKTNREIGQTLFLSPRTVGVHLYNAFPKLGVTARRQLPELVERFDR